MDSLKINCDDDDMFIFLVPGYISRSVAGSYDNEGIAIFALMFTYYLWVCLELFCHLAYFIF